jgi:hypothetical protein
MKTAEVQAIFNELRPQQVELIRAISERPQVDDSFLHQPSRKKSSGNLALMSLLALAMTGITVARTRLSIHSALISASAMCASPRAGRSQLD